MGKGTYQGGGTLLNPGSSWFTRSADPLDTVLRPKLALHEIAAADAEVAERRRLEVEAVQIYDEDRRAYRQELRSSELDNSFAEIARGLAASDKKE